MIVRVNFRFHGSSFGALAHAISMAMDGFAGSITQAGRRNKVRTAFASAASGHYLEALNRMIQIHERGRTA
jgi:hypothetical protein